jgi:hypothetical protein
MTKKDFQAIARALYTARNFGTAQNGNDALNADERDAAIGMLQYVVGVVADVLAADNPRFDRETFLLACADGNVTRQPRTVKAKPLCVQAMGCYCAGHARGNKASEPCDTRE